MKSGGPCTSYHTDPYTDPYSDPHRLVEFSFFDEGKNGERRLKKVGGEYVRTEAASDVNLLEKGSEEEV